MDQGIVSYPRPRLQARENSTARIVRTHGYTYRKTNHRCKYERCECLLCQLTRVSRLIMRHQQRLWRHLKDARRREEGRGTCW
ncbi:hypothetical protein Pcinc_014442 [Petrolisthes cinctipes]|uniref:Uncharacterized protein n=1 Tax=Petrolisthes cinctipes TaxID=88211 RepID=A0AAE1KP74_PETCI|nr:hypothetical protein Pcinc_014442 [Petrolisthes cinctipes]